jgi:ethanolamine permease
MILVCCFVYSLYFNFCYDSVLYCYFRLIFSMSRSGLLPRQFGFLNALNGAPTKALIAGTVTSLLFMLIAWLFLSSHGYVGFFSAGIFVSVSVYTSTFISFIIFRIHFKILDRLYVSLMGIPGAGLGIIISVIIMIGIAVTSPYSFLSFVVLLVTASLYYFYVAAARQKLSTEEKEVMMVAHVIKGTFE